MRSRLMQAGLAIAALMFVSAPNPVSADEGGCHSYKGDFTAVTEGAYSAEICLGVGAD